MHAEANFSCLRAATISRWPIILDKIFDDFALQHFEFHSNEQYKPADMAKWTSAQALEDLQHIYLRHTMQGDTCPTVILQICACVKQVLIGWKLIFGYMIQRQLIHRTMIFNQSESRIQDVWLVKNWSLCNVSAVAGPCTSPHLGTQGKLGLHSWGLLG